MWAANMSGESKTKNFFKAGAASVGLFLPVFLAGTWLSLGSLNLGWWSGLKAPQLIANWLNFPTGIGEAVYNLVHLVANVSPSPFVTVARALAMICLVVFGVRQWWLARHGGAQAVYRAAITLLAVAILMPPTLPWYLTWGFVLISAFPWERRNLSAVVAVSVFVTLVYYPTGEQALYDWWFIAIVVVVSLYAAASLLRPDPLGLIAAWRKPREDTFLPAAPAAPVPRDSGAPRP
jgi:alpha-1,6-mannosyltransferase